MIYEAIKKMFVQNEKNSGVHMVAGAASKVVASSITYPYQVVKTRLQSLGAEKMYSGTIDCAKKTYYREGIAGFYR
jgi:solute carrier family 25 folate transporter 32